ncbi:MAG: TonB-dependent receptor [Alcaligenaceae bacterium]|nr:TonB-dependent receptor [Alcaligenaceae bacterium]
MKSHSLNRLCLALCAAAPALAAAQTYPTPATTLETIVVTPTRTPTPLGNVPGDVSVVSEQELRAAGQDSVADILSRQNGIEISTSGGPQTQTSVFLRGTNPQQTLVLVDGIRINSLTSGAVNWNALDPTSIERIEIVRGAASSLYGSNAIGGVINVITRKGGGDKPASLWANMGVGRYDTFKSSAGISGSEGGFDYALSGSVSSSDGFSATNRLNTFGEYHADNDGYTQHSFTGALGYQWAKGQRIDLNMYNGYMNGQFDAGEWAGDTYALTRQQVYALTSTNQITDRWQSVLRFGFTQESADSRSYGSSFVFGNLQRSYLWQNNLALDANQTLSVLLERLEERASTGSTNYTINNRNTNSAGLVYRGDFNRHHVQASVRNDNISGYGNQATGGLSYSYDLTDTLTAGLSANTGFRAPTFADLYAPDIYGNVGNPNLKPERSRNFEASLRYSTDTTELGAVLYQNTIRDMIVGYVFDPALGKSTAKNIDEARIRGLTLSAGRTWDNTTLKASVDLMDPRNESPRPNLAGNQLQRRAKQIYRINAQHRLDALVLGAEYLFVGKRFDDAANRIQLGGYGLTNLTMAYDINKSVGVQVRWDNVFNKQYTTAYGYNAPGSNVFVNLSLRM